MRETRVHPKIEGLGAVVNPHLEANKHRYIQATLSSVQRTHTHLYIVGSGCFDHYLLQVSGGSKRRQLNKTTQLYALVHLRDLQTRVKVQRVKDGAYNTRVLGRTGG